MKSYNQIVLLVLGVCLGLLFVACVKEPIQTNSEYGSSNLSDSTATNVTYGNDTKQVYDFYLPKKRDSLTPVVLLIHGGAWKAGQKEDFNSYVNLIKTKWGNVAIFNMNYRLASNANSIHHEQIIADIDSAVSHIITNKNKYHISTNVGVIGASAGGQLASIYAYKYNSNIKCVGNIFGPTIINDWSWYNSTNIWLGAYTGDILSEYVGQTWDTTAYKAVSPYWNITSNSQPTIIFHGNLDPIVPVYQSQWMNSKLKSLGVKCEYHEYVAFHGFDDAQSSEVITKLVTFFKAHINE